MKNTKKRALYILAALLAALFVLSCLAGFAACGGDDGDDCADGHTVTTWTWVDGKEADCGNDGTRTGVCDVCGETVTETVKASGEHTWNGGEVTTAPTIYTKGVKTYTCSVCGDKKTEEIDKLVADDYTSNFLTGNIKSYASESASAYVTYNNQVFAGSEITVTFDTTSNPNQYQYVVDGHAAVMSDAQLSAFWGNGASSHANAQYITISFVANADEKFTIVTEKSPSGISIDGSDTNSDNTFYTLMYDVSAWSDTNKGETVFTITDDKGSYPVIIGDIELYTVVSTEENLKNAVAKDADIALGADITLATSELTISAENVTLDLNGHGLKDTSSNSNSQVVAVRGNESASASLTIKDSSTSGSGSVEGYVYGISVFGETSQGAENTTASGGTATATLTVEGGKIAGSQGAAISTNGYNLNDGHTNTNSRNYGGEVINICGGEIVSTGDVGIYLPNGTLNVTGGNISGKTGIEIRAGKANIAGGSVSAINGTSPSIGSGNGSISSGYAIAVIESSAYNKIVSVSVGGGCTLEGAVYVSKNIVSVVSIATELGLTSSESDSGYVYAVDDEEE